MPMISLWTLPGNKWKLMICLW